VLFRSGDVRTDLARVMRDFARKTDLDKLKQECVKNCSLKSDLEKLRSESAKKTEFYALKDTTARQAEATRRCELIVEDLDGRVFRYASSAPFDGIIAHLTSLCGGNIHDKGLVNLTSSSVWPREPDRLPKSIVDESSKTSFASNNLPDQWICFDFQSYRVKLTNYTIRSFNANAGQPHLRSWVIEGCDDAQHWIELDRRSANDHLNGHLNFATFAADRSALCRFIRLRQTGPDHSGGNWLVIGVFELFGTLRPC
jgi:hypothetical protein